MLLDEIMRLMFAKNEGEVIIGTALLLLLFTASFASVELLVMSKSR